MVELANCDMRVPHIIIGGRVRNFPIGYFKNSAISMIPYGVLAKLLVLHHHDRHHREIDTTVEFVRNETWPIKAMKIAFAIDAQCRICIDKRKRNANQQMGLLPCFRSEMLAPFTVTCMDLFGPYEIYQEGLWCNLHLCVNKSSSS